jgi:hypothetical protein
MLQTLLTAVIYDFTLWMLPCCLQAAKLASCKGLYPLRIQALAKQPLLSQNNSTRAWA